MGGRKVVRQGGGGVGKQGGRRAGRGEQGGLSSSGFLTLKHSRMRGEGVTHSTTVTWADALSPLANQASFEPTFVAHSTYKK